MRPIGDIALALDAAADAPSTVRDLCIKARVGFDAGRMTACRMVERGALVVVNDKRPALVVSARTSAQYLQAPPQASAVLASLDDLHRRVFGGMRVP